MYLSITDGDLSFHYKHDEKPRELQGTIEVYVNNNVASGNE